MIPAPPSWTDALGSVDDAILLLDATGRIVELTAAAEQILQLSPTHAVGHDIAQIFPAENSNTWLGELCHHALGPGALRRRSEGTLHRGRQDIPVLASCAPVLGHNGTVRGAVLILHDLTVQRELESQMRRADRLANLGTVTLGLAHEIRNPLGGIKGAAQLLRAALSDPEQLECTDVIVREVERLDTLLAQLRDLSQPHPLQRRAINVHRILTGVLTLQRANPSWGRITVRTAFDPSLPPVDADPGQLTQVFLNLLKNAVEAMQGSGQLLILTQFEHAFHIRRNDGSGRLLSVVIEDTGPGVPAAEQGELFTPFFTTKGGGTGLGLAICHRIVTEHGGSLSYEDGLAGGARFRVTLPVSDHDDTTD